MTSQNSANYPNAQCGTFRLNCTNHLDLKNSASKVSDAPEQSFEICFRQTKIATIPASPKQLRKQYGNSGYRLQGRFWSYICNTGLTVNYSV
ncbi:hypothetical protein CDL15_Pgr012921 [Punica granatum]|uniref:Uncharacterized protein n=1 Tax=Punica granatum TaxID=22663 RepID=A0A218XFC0_PUNGR|nr:hypothetical protein CDL15_Pgr012921 [Punica granatum]